jgi:hypothetical protein
MATGCRYGATVFCDGSDSRMLLAVRRLWCVVTGSSYIYINAYLNCAAANKSIQQAPPQRPNTRNDTGRIPGVVPHPLGWGAAVPKPPAGDLGGGTTPNGGGLGDGSAPRKKAGVWGRQPLIALLRGPYRVCAKGLVTRSVAISAQGTRGELGSSRPTALLLDLVFSSGGPHRHNILSVHW